MYGTLDLFTKSTEHPITRVSIYNEFDTQVLIMKGNEVPAPSVSRQVQIMDTWYRGDI